MNRTFVAKEGTWLEQPTPFYEVFVQNPIVGDIWIQYEGHSKPSRAEVHDGKFEVLQLPGTIITTSTYVDLVIDSRTFSISPSDTLTIHYD